MGGEINWTALPILVELHGVLDVEKLIVCLIAIREHNQRVRDAVNT